MNDVVVFVFRLSFSLSRLLSRIDWLILVRMNNREIDTEEEGEEDELTVSPSPIELRNQRMAYHCFSVN